MRGSALKSAVDGHVGRAVKGGWGGDSCGRWLVGVGVKRGDGYHVGAGEEVPVPPNPERRSQDGDPLTNADGEVCVMVGIWLEWLLCRCLDAGPRCVCVEGKPSVDL